MNSPIHAQDLSDARHLRTALLRWFDRHHRALPWRENKDPYRIWISEVMLQQTRVNAVLVHYREFLARFPDVRALAKARLSTVLAAWSGLGYYRRARALHLAARKIAAEHDGCLPSTAAAWNLLPGVGRYTAAAIASIAWDEPVAVLDGNVDRILRRLSGRPSLSQKAAWALAQELLSPQRPGDFNQAMMELGALVCLSGEPLCSACPLARWCATRGPLQAGKKERRRSKSIAYLLAEQDGRIRLVRRPAEASLMAGMWELPEIAVRKSSPEFHLRHAITVTDYRVAVFRGAPVGNGSGQWVPKSRLNRLALTGLSRKILRRAGLL